MGTYDDELADYDNDFAAAQEPGQPLPEGIYPCMVDDAYIVRGQKDPSALFVKVDLTVVDGPETGRTTDLFQRVNDPEPKKMGFAKRMLRSLGYEEPGLRGLEDWLALLPGRAYEVQVKRNGDYLNKYVQRRLEQSTYADDAPPPHSDEEVPF